jgi:hypothetical protein
MEGVSSKRVGVAITRSGSANRLRRVDHAILIREEYKPAWILFVLAKDRNLVRSLS